RHYRVCVPHWSQPMNVQRAAITTFLFLTFMLPRHASAQLGECVQWTRINNQLTCTAREPPPPPPVTLHVTVEAASRKERMRPAPAIYFGERRICEPTETCSPTIKVTHKRERLVAKAEGFADEEFIVEAKDRASWEKTLKMRRCPKIK